METPTINERLAAKYSDFDPDRRIIEGSDLRRVDNNVLHFAMVHQLWPLVENPSIPSTSQEWLGLFRDSIDFGWDVSGPGRLGQIHDELKARLQPQDAIEKLSLVNQFLGFLSGAISLRIVTRHAEKTPGGDLVKEELISLRKELGMASDRLGIRIIGITEGLPNGKQRIE